MLRLTSCLAVLVVVVGVGEVWAVTMPTPTHYYPFDTDYQDHAGTNHGTPVGGASIVADLERGNVLNLDGVDDWVSLSTSNIPVGPTDLSVFTIACWIKAPEIVHEYAIGIYGEFTAGQNNLKNVYELWGNEGVNFGQFPPTGHPGQANTPVNDGTWHHIAYVQNEDNNFQRQFYVDGVLDNPHNGLERYSGPDPNTWAIGARVQDDPISLLGRIDDLRFYDVALTADQIKTIPEPSTLLLLIIGALGLLAYRSRRRDK